MPKIVNTQELDYSSLDREQQGWIYNGLDCCLTDEIHSVLEDRRGEYVKVPYDFVRAMQGPAMAMGTRGIKIDLNLRGELIAKLSRREEEYIDRVKRMVEALGGSYEFNPKSQDQLKWLLYDVLQVEAQYKWNSVTKKRQISVDRNCLEKILGGSSFYARPIVKHVLAIRDLNKKIGTLKSGIDSDGRMRTSYNVSGTETGRWSSNSNPFGTGTNLQNITDELREIFIADGGMKFAYIDGEQAESRVVGYVSGDEKYIAACEGGDLHTDVARMVWPELDWSNEDTGHNRKVAEQKFYRMFSYRDMAKRLGHGTNYKGSPFVMAMHTKIERKLAEEFQERYFDAFGGIYSWHGATATQLQTKGYLETPLGRRRYFFGRLDSDDTLKEAIAYVPQSTVGEILNLGLYKVWEEFDLSGEIQCIAQIHDAIMIQYEDKGQEYQRDILGRVCKTMEIPIPTASGPCLIPVSVEGVGWNWRKHGKGNDNPDSLMEVRKDEQLKRTRQRSIDEATDLLARSINTIT